MELSSPPEPPALVAFRLQIQFPFYCSLHVAK